MKFVLAVCGLLAQVADGQGTVYLSNVSQPFATGNAVASDSWFAQTFRTGTNGNGYFLESVGLLLNPASGSPSSFTASIYSDVSGLPAVPGVSLAELSGPDPAAGGLFAYAAGNLTLSPETAYWVVAKASTPLLQGSYSLSLATAPYDSSDGWTGAAAAFASSDGLNWYRSGGVFQYAVTATPIPEPGICALVGSGLVALGFRCRRK